MVGRRDVRQPLVGGLFGDAQGLGDPCPGPPLAQSRADGVAFDAVCQAPQGHDRGQRLGGIGRDSDVVQVDYASTLIDARALVNKG